MAERGGVHGNKELNGALQRIVELEAERESCNAKIKALENDNRKRKASPPGQDNTASKTPICELQARCKELQQESDMYRAKWARGVIDNNASLTDLWEVVENTDRQIKELYQGIETLSFMFGVNDGVLDMPQVLHKIIARVSTMADDESIEMLQLRISNLRLAISRSQTKCEELQHQFNTKHAELERKRNDIRLIQHKVICTAGLKSI